MAAHRLLLAAAVSFSLAGIASPQLCRAEDAPASGDVELAKHSFIGAINGTSVFVRSAPREDAYPTMKLEKGDKVTVVGIKFKWLKILPPEGSFAYVPKAYVNQRGDGKLGRASREVIAKVGSSLNQLKTAPMAKIDDGQDVVILGEQDDYYKIKPPEGTYLYVNESFVDPVQMIPTPGEKKPHDVIAKVPDDTVVPPRTPKIATTTESNETGPAVSTTVTPPIDGTGVTPTTLPSEAVASALDSFTKLEADFKTAGEKPITDQPIDTLLAGYTDLLKLNDLTPRMRQISQVRVSTLKLRSQAKTEFLAMRDTQIQAADRQKALVAEHDEIQQRIKQKQVTFYTAVGTLRASSIQRGNGTLYRLTDPVTFRTIVYIRTDDSAYAGLIGQFVGVKGNVSTDAAMNMKIIDQPSPAQVVDQTKVNDTVAAQIIPPSLAARTPTAGAAD